MHNRRFKPELAQRLDNPERTQWLPPADVLAAIGVRSGETVADIGAGTGYFAFPLAEAVAPQGKVYAIDAQEEMLALLRSRVAERRATNIELVHAEGERIALPDAWCHLVFTANVWHEFSDRAAMLRESLRVLRPQGRLALLDWSPDADPEHGPPLAHRLTAQSAAAELQAAGFTQISQLTIGRYSWLVQARAPENPR